MTRSRSSKVMRPAGDFEVGYGKPPIARRYKLGDVGNPKGRPKRKKTVGQTIQEALMTRITIEENGRSRTVTAQEVIIRNLVHAAARRDIRAIHALFSLRDRYHDSAETTLDPTNLESEDHKIIEEHLAGLQASGADRDARTPDGEANNSVNQNKSTDGENKGAPDDF